MEKKVASPRTAILTSMLIHIAVANLVTQRNAIRMLYDRLAVLLRYVSAVTQGQSFVGSE